MAGIHTGRNIVSSRSLGSVLVAGLMFLALPAFAGTLRLGKPDVDNNRYTFPVVLQGNAEGVAALDFRLSYDPDVFRPVGAESGPNALQAQKQVSSNIAAPGEFVVVMMGFNQNSVTPGEVVEVVLEKVGEPASGKTTLRIAEPTLATHAGIEVDSRGLARTLKFGDDKTESNDESSEIPPEESTDPAAPDKEPARPDEMQGPARTVNGSPLFVTNSEISPATPSIAATTTSGDTTKPRVPGVPNNTAPSSPATLALQERTSPLEPSQQPAGTLPESNGGTSEVARPGPESAEMAAVDVDGDRAKNAAEGNKDQLLTEDKAQEIKKFDEKGRHGGGRYATILLLAVGTPLGLFLLLRVAGR